MRVPRRWMAFLLPRACPRNRGTRFIVHTVVHVPSYMPLVRATLPDSEYDLLRQRARKEGKPMSTVIREALRAHLLPDVVDPKDAVFQVFPLQPKKGRVHWASRNHDDILYPS
jgi:hypothetical protein